MGFEDVERLVSSIPTDLLKKMTCRELNEMLGLDVYEFPLGQRRELARIIYNKDLTQRQTVKFP